MDKQAIDKIKKALTGAEGRLFPRLDTYADVGFDDGGGKARQQAAALARDLMPTGDAARKFEALERKHAERLAARARKAQAAAIKGSRVGAKLMEGGVPA